MKVKFSKNVFFSNETVSAVVHFDNSQSDVAISKVNFSVLQNLCLRVQGHSFDKSYNLHK
jgi:hypothetical protein